MYWSLALIIIGPYVELTTLVGITFILFPVLFVNYIVKTLLSQVAINYKKFKNIINPNDLPIGICQYQIDHIYSMRVGFENNVDPTIIAHIANLRLMWHVDNKSKHIRCDQTLDELMDKTKGA
jgi:hypothetical protein